MHMCIPVAYLCWQSWHSAFFCSTWWTFRAERSSGREVQETHHSSWEVHKGQIHNWTGESKKKKLGFCFELCFSYFLYDLLVEKKRRVGGEIIILNRITVLLCCVFCCFINGSSIKWVELYCCKNQFYIYISFLSIPITVSITNTHYDYHYLLIYHSSGKQPLFGWVAGGWEAYFPNYRHYASQCPVSILDWLPNFPHKAWVDLDKGLFTFQVNRRELSRARTAITSITIKVHDHYTTAPLIERFRSFKKVFDDAKLLNFLPLTTTVSELYINRKYFD